MHVARLLAPACRPPAAARARASSTFHSASSLAEFREVTGPFLRRDAAANGHILVPDWPRDGAMAGHWLQRDEDGEVVAAAMLTSCAGVLLAGAEPAALKALAEPLWPLAGAFPAQVVGPRAAVDAFCDSWAPRHSALLAPCLAASADSLQAWPPLADGEAAAAGLSQPEEPTPLLLEWMGDFFRETSAMSGLDTSFATPEYCNEHLLFTTRHRGLCLLELEGRGPVAMLTMHTDPQEPALARLSCVYTPPALRGRGYASTLVGAVTEYMLSSGPPDKLVSLLTDANNPVSNALYERLGYARVGEFLVQRVSGG